MRNCKIIATGKYLPEKIVFSNELDLELGLKEGWTYKKSGIVSRRYVADETNSSMGAIAIKRALDQAGLTFRDIDALIYTSGSIEQAIPSTASLIQEQLGELESGVPCFDINSTCLSFVTGLDHLSYAIHFGRYNRVVFVASEIASIALDYEKPESSVLFGDGAVAVVVEKSEDSSKILASRMETYSKGAHQSEILAGGTKIHPRTYSESTKRNFVFQMDGRAIFRLSSRLIEGFMERFLGEGNLQMSDIDFVIPHQASGMAMRIMREKLGIPAEKFMDIIEDHGNMIAASIPCALHEAIERGRIKRGDKVMLIGTSAGLSLGGLVFEY